MPANVGGLLGAEGWYSSVTRVQTERFVADLKRGQVDDGADVGGAEDVFAAASSEIGNQEAVQDFVGYVAHLDLKQRGIYFRSAFVCRMYKVVASATAAAGSCCCNARRRPECSRN